MIKRRIHQFFISLALLFVLGVPVAAQPIQWEGTFMNDFKVILTIEDSLAKELTGKIEMYAGNDQIQNDILTDILMGREEILFRIPAKDSRFEGIISTGNSKITGEFIFPDGSRHPLEVFMVDKQDNKVENLATIRMKKLSPAQMHEDYQLLSVALKENHPNLYEYTTISEFAEMNSKIESKLSSDLSVLDFYYQMSTLTNAVQCSHTGVRLPQSYRMAMELEGLTFPLNLYFANEKAYVIGNDLSDLEIGSEILRINERSIEEIIEQLFTLIPANSEISSTKYYVLNSSFHALYPIIDQESEYTIEYQLDEVTKTKTVSAVPLKNLTMNNLQPQQESVPMIDHLNSATSYLKISTFAIRDMDNYFYELDGFFKYLQNEKVNNIILDLRGNAGGHPIFAAQLLSYLTDKEFVYFKRNEEIKDFEPLYNIMLPNELNFKGSILVLVNGGCLSTTGHLISLLKYHTNAVFIGDEPGSTYRCNDFSEKITLPNSGLEVNIPRTVFETVVTGIAAKEPMAVDYETVKDIDKVIAGSDLEMQIAIKLSQSNN